MSKIKFVLIWIFLVTSFLSLGFILVVQATGFKVDWQNFKIQRTGLIYIKSFPEDPQVFLNGKLTKLDRRNSLTMLSPQRYDVEIKKANYQTWAASVEVKPGLASMLDSVQLFLKDPQILKASAEENKRFENLGEEKDIKIVNDSEIRILKGDKARLVTRFSQPIKNVRWFPDKKHLAYISQGEIRIIELNGANNMLLLKIQNNADVKYYFQKGGSELVFKVGNEVKKARIQ